MCGDGQQPSTSSLHVGRMPLWGGRASTPVDARLYVNARATSRSLDISSHEIFDKDKERVTVHAS